MSKRANKTYIRQQGNKADKGVKRRCINFNLSKIVPDQGQSLQQWNDDGLLLQLMERIKQIGALTREETIHQKLIKEYSSKTGFPPNSEFTNLPYLNPERWAVMHITNNSIEVVAGFIEDDIFYVVFLDKEHKFWPTNIQDRGKNRR